MKKPFEEYIAFLENDLGYQFFESQKALMRQVYEGKHVYYCANRYCNTHWLYEAMRRLKEEMDRDNGNLLPWTYKPDSYSTTVVTCDENWGENIEWEKENKL